MKVMVNIVYFSNNQKSFLNQLVEEYNKYPAHVDIFIHSNKKKLKDLNKSLYKNGSILIKKYNIPKKNILGHSDISPDRKKDPGEKFPWKKLAKKNLCKWHNLDEKKIKKYRNLKISLNVFSDS